MFSALTVNARVHPVYSLHEVYHLKRNQKQSRATVQKWNQKHVHPRVMNSTIVPSDLSIQGHPGCQAATQACCAKSCADVSMAYSRTLLYVGNSQWRRLID
jgi:hypothetical protein